MFTALFVGRPVDNPDELAELCDEAIATMQWVAACAKAAQPILKASKEKLLARKGKPKAKKAP